MSRRVRVELRGHHARLRFDDGQMNLLSNAGLDAIREALDSIDHLIREGPRRRTTVLTFESGRAGLFAAGADMQEMRSFDPLTAGEFSKKGQDLFARLTRFPALTVAIVDGDCFGGALDFLMAFDLRIGTPRARFSHPGAKIGIVTGFGGTSSWRHTARSAAVGTLFLDNEIIECGTANSLGLVHCVSEEPESVIRDLVERIPPVRMLPELKRLATTEKNLESLVLLSKRLNALHEASGKEIDGYSRDASRHLFG
ncbi:MAG: enoyl-CoA hydratase/isomerase family protein [Thermoanaerobaculia bacterium]|nr:enoyl-CoA hydratase/isomerase family protein [Thermoanaerobaculia bacterium]